MSSKLLKAANKASPTQLKTKLEKAYPNMQAELKDHSQLTISLYQTKSLPAELREWIYKLFERNMKAMYEASPTGYNAAEKKAELFDPASRFIVLREQPPSSPPTATPSILIGYTIFRFDTEETIEGIMARVAYCYELQVEPNHASRGAGKVLMGILEKIGKDWEMEKVVLTALKANSQALGFYNRIGYRIDGISPSQCGDDSEYYEIMSKVL